MHEFKITIKLDNKDCCNGCVCLHGSTFETGWFCKQYNEFIEYHIDTFPEIKNSGYFDRPDICKQNDGGGK